MWKAAARDALCLFSAVIVLTILVSAFWLAFTLWLMPRTAVHVIGTDHDTIRWVAAVVVAPIVVAFASVGVLLYAALRGRARRGRPITPPYWRDALLVPFLVGLALGLGFLVVTVLTGGKEDAVAAFLVGLGQAVPLSLAAWSVVLVQRFSARPARTLTIAAAALIAMWLVGRITLDAWGGRMFEAYKSAAFVEIAAERQRIAAERLPILFGTPIEANAAERYRQVADRIAHRADHAKALRGIAAAVKDGPGKPRSGEVTQWVAACQTELQELREAVRCTRCDWQYPWERGFDAPFPELVGARQAASLLVIEGYQRAEAGDAEGAVERDLEVVRMGRDYEGSGGLIGALMAFALEGIGADALLRLIASDGLAAQPDWDTIQSRLDLLEPRLASMSVAYRGERLCYVGLPLSGLANQAHPGESRFQRLVDPFFPGRFFEADYVRTMNEALREMERANDLADPRETKRLSQAALDRALRGPNVLVHISLPSLARARESQDFATARFRLLRAAVQLERTRGKGECYPDDASAVDLPIDPFAYPARLHYVSLAGGKGYKLWSVGENGKDDGGVAKDRADEVFERPSPVPRSR